MPSNATASAHIIADQIGGRLHQIFDDLVQIERTGGIDNAQVEQLFLSRSLAALSLMHLSECNASDAAASITDGGKDDGIDAIYVSEGHKKIYLIQSKWLKNNGKGIKLDEFTRFRDGVKRVISLKWDNQNKDLHHRKDIIERVLKDIDVEIVMVFAHTSEHELSLDIASAWSEFLDEQNQYGAFIRSEVFTLKEAREAARSKTRPEDISVSVMLRHWGRIMDPYKAVYGSVAAQDLVAWIDTHKEKLFAENLRFGIEKSEVNDGIIKTAAESPENFWYYNNGITAICDDFEKSAVGGNDTSSGVFEVSKISVINGAQTITSLMKARDHGSSLDGVSAHMRIISLAQTPENFSIDVTTANNTQNDLSPMDFVAADAAQDRIRREAAQIGLVYSYRRGDHEPGPESGFNLRDATISAACASGDLRLAVSAKRYISGLWENTKREPYTRLFNDGTDAAWLWKAVRVARIVDSTLDEISSKTDGRERLVATHANRFVLFHVFQKINPISIEQEISPDFMKQISTLVEMYFNFTFTIVELDFPDAYPGNIFKNTERQTEISTKLQELENGMMN